MDNAFERIGLTSVNGVTTFADLIISYSDGNALIQLGNTLADIVFGDSITLIGVGSGLTESEFIFGDDTIVGTDENNYFAGSLGTDNLYGMNGSDTLSGRSGDDYLSGGGS